MAATTEVNTPPAYNRVKITHQCKDAHHNSQKDFETSVGVALLGLGSVRRGSTLRVLVHWLLRLLATARLLGLEQVGDADSQAPCDLLQSCLCGSGRQHRARHRGLPRQCSTAPAGLVLDPQVAIQHRSPKLEEHHGCWKLAHDRELGTMVVVVVGSQCAGLRDRVCVHQQELVGLDLGDPHWGLALRHPLQRKRVRSPKVIQTLRRPPVQRPGARWPDASTPSVPLGLRSLAGHSQTFHHHFSSP